MYCFMVSTLAYGLYFSLPVTHHTLPLTSKHYQKLYNHIRVVLPETTCDVLWQLAFKHYSLANNTGLTGSYRAAVSCLRILLREASRYSVLCHLVPGSRIRVWYILYKFGTSCTVSTLSTCSSEVLFATPSTPRHFYSILTSPYNIYYRMHVSLLEPLQLIYYLRSSSNWRAHETGCIPS